MQRGTHSVSYLQVCAPPEARQRVSILAGGGEGKADVLWVVPHRQLHFRANVLRTERSVSSAHRNHVRSTSVHLLVPGVNELNAGNVLLW